jgi:hypothetical protein
LVKERSLGIYGRYNEKKEQIESGFHTANMFPHLVSVNFTLFVVICLGSGVRLFMRFFQTRDGHVGVDLGSRKIGVP